MTAFPVSAKQQLPDKLYFRIGEVSEIAGVPAYVLRFWETEFSRIKPKRSPSGQRIYRKKDVLLILQIKHLLYEKKFTIQGAKQHLLRDNSMAADPTSAAIHEIRQELLAIRKLLKNKPPRRR